MARAFMQSPLSSSSHLKTLMERHHFQCRQGCYYLILSLLALLFISGTLLPVALGQGLPIVVEGEDTVGSPSRRVYIVHVRRAEHMLSASREDLEAWHKSFLPTAYLDSGEQRLVYSYHEAISGFAARLTAQEVKAMEGKEGFLYAQPDEPLIPETTHTPNYLRLKGSAGSLWNVTVMGRGMVIGVVDTGIRPTHTSFSGAGMPGPPSGWKGLCEFNNASTCNNKLIGARTFNASGVPSPPYDGPSGHGTHVAGIAAGNFVGGANNGGFASGTAAGAAPRAYISLYHAVSGADMLAAFDQAFRDRVDVLSVSMSIKNNDFYKNQLVIAALSATRGGILVSCAAGNYGPGASTVRNDAPWQLTVGSSTTDRAMSVKLTLGDGTKFNGVARGKPDVIPSSSRVLVYPGAGREDSVKTCRNDTLGGVHVRGKMVLCLRDPTVSQLVQAGVVKSAGGAAMVLMNDQRAGSAVDDLFPFLSVFTVATNYRDSLHIERYVSSSAQPTAMVTMSGTRLGVHPYPVVNGASSRGPSTVNNGILKPDIVGPGVDILAASATSDTGFVFKTGTSMATPHISGVAAMLRSIHRSWSPAMIRSAIMTTADNLDSRGGLIADQTGNPANFYTFGAGQVNAPRASDPGLVYDIKGVDYDRYICGLGYTQKLVEVVAGHAVNCSSLGSISGEDLNYPSISVRVGAAPKVVRRTVTNVSPGTTSTYVYTAETLLPAGVSVSVSPNIIVFTGRYQTASFTVTFALSKPTAAGTIYHGWLYWKSTGNTHQVASPVSISIG